MELQDHDLRSSDRSTGAAQRRHRNTAIVTMISLCGAGMLLHDVVVCIQTGKQLDDEDRLQFDGTQAYLKSPQEMLEAFPDHRQALARTVEIMERCQVQLDFDTVHLPRFELPPGFDSADEYLRTLAYQGAARRFGEISQRVRDRLDYELKTISEMGYSDYLIVWDCPLCPGAGDPCGPRQCCRPWWLTAS